VALGCVTDQASYRRAPGGVLIEVDDDELGPLVGRFDRLDYGLGLVGETKQSRALLDAARLQLKFYLWLLRLVGARPRRKPEWTGELRVPAARHRETVTLEECDAALLRQHVLELRELESRQSPPPACNDRDPCAKCAFLELCHG
jgi:CRISPR/Cas system-associated exonuclease Cas4 (RecB family)